MLVPRKNRLEVYTHLFRNGVIAVKKDIFAAKHQQIDVPNVQVMKLMVVLKSKDYITEVFSWQWHYFTLTAAGVEYLRNYLHLADDVLPNTHKKAENAPTHASFAQPREQREFAGRRGGNTRMGDRSAPRGPRRTEKSE